MSRRESSTGRKALHGHGSLVWEHGKCTWRVSLPGQGRVSFPLTPTITTETKAQERQRFLVKAKDALIQAGRLEGTGTQLLTELARAGDSDTVRAVERGVERLCHFGADKKVASITVAEFATQWYTGELVAKLRDSDRKVALGEKSAKDREIVFRDEINPHVGHIPLIDVQEEDGDTVKEKLPSHLDDGTRRLHLGYLFRLFELAVKARHIKVNPLRKGFVPPRKDPRSVAKAFLYPDEEARLAGCRQILLKRRVLNALLFREGMRSSEAKTLLKDQIDRVHGTIRLDKTKQGRAGFWDLRKDTFRALCIWMDMNPRATLLFEGLKGNDGAAQFRQQLKRAGISRPELWEDTKVRRHIVWHDTRASYMVVMSSIGKSDAWIFRRTGHGSDDMMRTHYQRTADTIEHLNLGDFLPMDEVIPELAEFARRARGEVPKETMIETRSLQAYLYRGEGQRRTHSVEVADGQVVRVLCCRVETTRHFEDADPQGVSQKPTCDYCVRQDPRWVVSPKEKWFALVSSFETSGQFTEEFCSARGLNINTFRRWLSAWRKTTGHVVRRGKKEWLALVSSREASGESPEDFCAKRGLSLGIFLKKSSALRPAQEPVPVVYIAGTLPARGPRGREMLHRLSNFPEKAPFATVRAQRGILGAGPEGGSTADPQMLETTVFSGRSTEAPESTSRQCTGNVHGTVAAKLFALLPALVRVGRAVEAQVVRAAARALALSQGELVDDLTTALGQLAEAGVGDAVTVVDEALGEVLGGVTN